MALVGYWKFNADGADASGNGHDATLVGAIIDTSEKKLGAGSLFTDGLNDYAKVDDDEALDGFDDFTIRFWMKAPQQVSKWAIGKYSVGAAGRAYVLGSTGDGKFLRVLLSTTGAFQFSQNSTVVAFDDTWKHCIITRSGSNVYTYINNNKELIGTLSGTLHNSGEDLYFGCMSLAQGNFMEGNLDGIAIYNHAWDDSDVSADWNGGAGREISIGVAGRRRRMLIGRK